MLHRHRPPSHRPAINKLRHALARLQLQTENVLTLDGVGIELMFGPGPDLDVVSTKPKKQNNR
jgi:hypothetical protein